MEMLKSLTALQYHGQLIGRLAPMPRIVKLTKSPHLMMAVIVIYASTAAAQLPTTPNVQEFVSFFRVILYLFGGMFAVVAFMNAILDLLAKIDARKRGRSHKGSQ